MRENTKVHLSPAWKEQSNFILMARIESSDSNPMWEQMWARQVEPNLFELCCIPFFVYNLALGDYVTCDIGSGHWTINGVAQPSGHYTFRVWLDKSPSRATLDSLRGSVRDLNCLCEAYSKRLIGVDAPSPSVAQLMLEELSQAQNKGHYSFETGWTSQR